MGSGGRTRGRTARSRRCGGRVGSPGSVRWPVRPPSPDALHSARPANVCGHSISRRMPDGRSRPPRCPPAPPYVSPSSHTEAPPGSGTTAASGRVRGGRGCGGGVGRVWARCGGGVAATRGSGAADGAGGGSVTCRGPTVSSTTWSGPGAPRRRRGGRAPRTGGGRPRFGRGTRERTRWCTRPTAQAAQATARFRASDRARFGAVQGRRGSTHRATVP